MKILGIDPGYERLGWGLIEKTATINYLACGIIRTSKDLPLQQRLLELSQQFDTLLAETNPDVASVEELFFSTNKTTAIAVAQSRGILLYRLAVGGISTKEYSPSAIKSIVTGDGRADKKAVEKMVRLQLPGVPGNLIDDTLDALAAALCYSADKSYG